MKLARILYFVEGPAPTARQLDEAFSMNATVVFRNALAVPAEAHSLELCDGVAGVVPQLYADTFPTAEVAIAAKVGELKALSDKVGDEAAPKMTASQAAAAKKASSDADKTVQGQQANGNQSAPSWNGTN